MRCFGFLWFFLLLLALLGCAKSVTFSASESYNPVVFGTNTGASDSIRTFQENEFQSSVQWAQLAVVAMGPWFYPLINQIHHLDDIKGKLIDAVQADPALAVTDICIDTRSRLSIFSIIVLNSIFEDVDIRGTGKVTRLDVDFEKNPGEVNHE